VLVEKMLKFKLLASHSFHIPAGEAQFFTSFRPPRATNRIKVFRTARPRAAPVGREKVDANSQQVICTRALREMWSRKSEISSSEEAKIWVGTTRLGLCV
jgi:hypothetical protein